MKKLMSLREGLHVMMAMLCATALRWSSLATWTSRRTCIVERTCNEEIHKRINHLLREWTCVQMERLRPESSEYVRKTTGFFTNRWRIKIALESYFKKHAQEFWERDWMNPEMQTTLLNTCPPKLIAKILKALREQLKESDQLHSVEEIAGPVPEIPLEYDQILKEEGKFWDDVNGAYLPEDLVLAARREEIDWVHSEGVYEIVPMQECRDTGMKRWTWFGLTHTSLWTRHARKFDRSCVQEKTKRRSKVRFNELCQLLNCSLQCHLSKLRRCLSQSWCRWVCRTKRNHWSWGTTTSAEGISKEQPRDSFTSDFPQRIVRSKVGRLIKSMYGTLDASHILQLDYVNLICGELGGSRRGKHTAALFHNPSQDVRMAAHGDDFVCLSDDDRLKHIDSLLKSKYTAKDRWTLGFEDSDVKSLLLLNRVFWVIEPDLRHAPLCISESGCNTNTNAASTPRERNCRTNWC